MKLYLFFLIIESFVISKSTVTTPCKSGTFSFDDVVKIVPVK